jgi:hypothetical protein
MTKGRIYICLIIIVITASIVFLYNDNYFYTGEPPLLKAETLITRIKPEDPGGMVLDDYNSIYDQIKSQNHNIKSVTLIPEPELPIAITPIQDIAETDAIDSIVSGIIDTNITPQESKENIENIETAKSLKIITSSDNHNIKTQVKRLKAAYYVQVASTRTTTQAKKEFIRITKSHGKLLANIEHKIDKYNIANKGAYYRLLLGPLNGSAHAKLICKKLATAKQTCIIKKI